MFPFSPLPLIFVLKDTFYAIPILSLTAVQEYKTSDLQTLFKQNHRIKYNYDEYHLLYLRSALGYVDNQIDENENQSVIFLRYKAARTAVIVDRLIGSWEVVVKPLPIQLQEIKEFSGVTFLSDERPVLMLDPYTLTHKTYYLQNGVNQDPLTQLKPAIILIVDDSVTVRRITSGVLRRHHYDPRQARNGEEALQYMEAHRPDVVLLDLEMPGMDGFEVLEKMRLDPRLNNIPVIIITSRVGEKHQLQAQKFGISGYLSKPYLEDDLLNLLSDIVNA